MTLVDASLATLGAEDVGEAVNQLRHDEEAGIRSARCRVRPKHSAMRGGDSFLPPRRVLTSALLAFCVVFFACFYLQHLMASVYLTVLVVAVLCYGVRRLSLPRVDDALAERVILGDASGAVPLFAHRGAGHDAPENTLAAFREAKRNNASGVEFDISFTHDNVAVLFHDDTVDRTTDGSGALAAMPFEDVRRLDASANHPFAHKYPGEKVPTLDEGVGEALRLGLRLIFDVKEHDHRAVTVVDDLFRKHTELYERALVASFYPQFVYALRIRNPGIVTALTWRPGFVAYEDVERVRPRFKSPWAHWMALAGDWMLDSALHSWLPHVTGVSAVLICKNTLSSEYVDGWRRQGVHVIAWTPNHPAEKEYFAKVLRVPIITDTLR